MIKPEERAQLIAIRIQQAEKAISQVEFCLANDQPEMAPNRIYYGMFYAMLALALVHSFETSKHQQLIGWFNKNFVHTDIFPKRFTPIIKKAFDARMDSDYAANQIITTGDLELLLADMKLFIATIKAWIEANPAT